MNSRTIIRFLLAAFIVHLSPAVWADQKPQASPDNAQVEQTETGFYYTVKKGDTLWNLSRRFLDSSWVWPGLWKENKQIPNPHLIYPGQKIRLYLRKDVDAAYINREIGSFQSESAPMFRVMNLDKVGFVRNTRLEASATIIRDSDNKLKSLMREGDEVFILPGKKASLSVGDLYTICRHVDTLLVGKENTRAYQYFVTGIAEITHTGSGYATARIDHSFRTVEKGDLLLPYKKQRAEFKLVKKPHGLNGTILKAEEDQEIFSYGAFAFIDRGTASGVMQGQVYSVYNEDTLTLSDPYLNGNIIHLSTKDFGSILVILAEETVSTVMVLKSRLSLEPGTKFH